MRGVILDLGIGFGYFERYFRKFLKAPIVGVDIDIEMLRKCRHDIKVLADGNALPFRKKSFDGIVCLDTIHLVKSYDYRRVLKPRSFVLISTFFNSCNFSERRAMLKRKTKGFRVTEKISEGRENEIIVLALR